MNRIFTSLMLAVTVSTAALAQTQISPDKIRPGAVGTVLAVGADRVTKATPAGTGLMIGANGLTPAGDATISPEWIDTQRVAMADELIAPGVTISPYMVANHNGYLPTAPKVLILRDPINGNDGALSYSITGKTYFLVNVRTGAETALAAPTQFVNSSAGTTDVNSGDAGWYVDFSSITTQGHYYIAEKTSGAVTARTYGFTISSKANRPLARAALKAIYYNRSCYQHLTKWSDYTLAGTQPWAAGATGQTYKTAVDFDSGASPRDLCGGWGDAGDDNLYPQWMTTTTSALLAAYWMNKTLWDSPAGDQTGIPESGNGIPDILDEVKIGIDLYLKFQNPNSDGTVISKAGCVGFNCNYLAAPAGQAGLASGEFVTRRYYAERRASAHANGCSSVVAASALALSSAAYHFSTSKSAIRDPAYIATLKAAATANYNRFVALDGANQLLADCTPNASTTTIVFGDADDTPGFTGDNGFTYQQRQRGTMSLAAAYLWQIEGSGTTGLAGTYRTYTLANYQTLQPYAPFTYFSSNGRQALNIEMFRLSLIGMDTTLTTNVNSQVAGYLNSTGNGTFVPATNNTALSYLYRCRIKDYVYNSNVERTALILWGSVTKRYPISAANGSNANRYTVAQACTDYMSGANTQNLAMISNMNGPPYYMGGSTTQVYHYSWSNHGSTGGGGTVPNGGNQFASYSSATPAQNPGPPPGYIIDGPTQDSRIADTNVIANTLVPPYPVAGGVITNQPLDKRFRDCNTAGVVGQQCYVFTEPGVYWQADFALAMLLMDTYQ